MKSVKAEKSTLGGHELTKTAILGIDTGNFATKTEHTSLPSGFRITSSVPTIGDEDYLSYHGKIYVPSADQRVEYVRDKTNDDTHFILTLLGIGSELMYRIEKSGENPQEAADKIEEVHLAVGLPPAHHAKLAAAYKEYFLRHFGQKTEFVFNGIRFCFHVATVRVLAQDYTAVLEYGAKSKYARITNGKFETSLFYAVDIGGKTVDYVEIRNGKPANFDSLDDGILTMIKSIEKNLRADGDRVDDILCEMILRGDNVRVSPRIKASVETQAKEWTEKILRKLDNDINLRSVPVIFIGGGARLLKPYIQKSKLLDEYEFLGGASANAVAYGKFMRDLYKAGGLS